MLQLQADAKACQLQACSVECGSVPNSEVVCLAQALAASRAEVLQLQASAKASQLQLHQLTSAVGQIGELEAQVQLSSKSVQALALQMLLSR